MKIPLPAAIMLCDLLYNVQPAYSQNWVSNNVPSHGWAYVASSADGGTLVAVSGNYGPIYSSTNSGATWKSNNVPNCAWQSVASSADGTKLVAVGQSAYQVGAAYVSTNSGASWTQTQMPFAGEYEVVASSADGIKLVLVGWNSRIYLSTNSGATWIPTGNSDQYTTVASSADGTKLVAAGWNTSAIYVSTNSGVAWMLHSVPFQSMLCSACSADGTKMVVAGDSDFIYVSSDSGSTWTESTNVPQTGWSSIALAANGSKIAAYNDLNKALYSSTNLGVTWASNTLPNYSPSVASSAYLASSADGNKLIAASYAGPIYTAYSTPTPKLDIVPMRSNCVVSWTVPATNFVLQQKFDLAGTNWVTLTNMPTLNLTNLQYQITLLRANGSGFYRLATP